MVSQNLTNVQFNCSGIITGYRLCNRSTDDYISVGLGVWRRGSGVLNTRATYLFDNNTHEGIGLNYNRGDQLMFVIIYYGNTSINEYKYVQLKVCIVASHVLAIESDINQTNKIKILRMILA